MSRFRFVHAADLHLDTPFSGIGRAAPGVRDALRDASLDAFDALVELTVARRAEFLLLAGDIYDGPERGIRAQIRFRRGLERLAAAGIQAVLVHGNHDSLGGWSALDGAWPPGVTLLGSSGVTAVPIERDGSRLATVYGMSYPKRDVTENLARRFARDAAMGLHVGLLHCNVGGDLDHAPYSPCSIDDLRKAGMDYWALGHIHRRQVLRDGAPWIVYPGNTQGRSPKPSECGAKGATVVDAEDGAVRALEFVPVDRVRFLKTVVDVSDAADAASVVDAVSRSAAALRSEHDGRGLVVDVELTGVPGSRTNGQSATPGERDGLRQQLRRPEVREGMLQELRHEWEGERPFLWWRSLEESTRLQVDPDLVRGRGDFSAQLVEVCDRLAAEPARIEALMDERSEALRRMLCGPGLQADALEGASAALLPAARALALDLLESDETS